MASYDFGTDEMVKWVKKTLPKGSTCLDVGACDGKWYDLLGDYLEMDAVEAFWPNILKHRLYEKYGKVYGEDAAYIEYDWYDLIIFGDVLEHMTVGKAQKTLAYAYPRCKEIIIGIPFLFTQGEIYGNPWERHIQDDLTPELFNERYKGFEMYIRPVWEYAYYIKERK